MLALGESQSVKLLGAMHPDEIKDVSSAMAQLGSVHASVVEALCAEFTASIGQQGALVGSLETTERLLLRALPPDRAAQMMEEIRGPAGRTMWDNWVTSTRRCWRTT